MILTKAQILEIEKAYNKANKLQLQANAACVNLSEVIERVTGVACSVDYLPGDGFGVTPVSDDDTHVPVYKLLEDAKDGIEIDEEYMLDNLSI